MTNQNDISYNGFLNKLINELQMLKTGGAEITAAICVSQLDPTKDNKKIRDYASETLKIDKRDFDRELRKKAVAIKLGKYPNTAGEFVEIIIQRRQIGVKYNGTVSEPCSPFCDFSLILKEMRAEAAELHLPFAREEINDAADIWYQRTKAGRLPILKELVAYDPAVQEAGLNALTRIATMCFDEDVGLVCAALLKFMHQVKRKMHGLTVENHLMLVLLGEQGGGKSSLCRALFSPLAEAYVSCTFTDMANDRIIDLWKNYIGFCDEMVGGNKADNAVIKHAITAEFINRRPMTTNLFIAVPQNLTFIGTSNATEFQEILRNSTGTRRYLGLKCKPLLDWNTVNSTDWFEVWQAVDQQAADPMTPFWEPLKEKQEVQREKTKVEVWLDQFNPDKHMGGLQIGQRKPAAVLHDDFREFEEKRFPGHFKTDVTAFGRQLSAIRSAPFKKAKKNGFWVWRPNADADVPVAEHEQGETEDEDKLEARILRMRQKTSDF